MTLLPSFLPAKLSYKKHQQKQKQPKQRRQEQQGGNDSVHVSEDTPSPTDGPKRLYPFYLPTPILKRRKDDNPTTSETSRPKRSRTVSRSTSNSVADPSISPVSRKCVLKDNGDIVILRKKKKKKGKGVVPVAPSKKKSPKNQSSKASTAYHNKKEQTPDLTCTETIVPTNEYIYDGDSIWDEEYEQLWADDDYVDVMNSHGEKGFQRLDRPRRTVLASFLAILLLFISLTE